MTLDEIHLRLKILDEIIRGARADGDERWHEAARQAEVLNEKRSAILKATGNIPPPVTIQAKVGSMDAKEAKGI
jgi:hypothetical protein